MRSAAFCYMFLCVALLTGGALVFADDRAHTDAPANGDIQALEAAYDRYFAAMMPELKIPGVSLSVVWQGRPVILKGYGYGRVSPPEPVCPENTLFRIGSVTKVLTATAAMQCVERGWLDLHQDVNERLVDLQVPASYDEPITLWHLLTHTAGFDDRFLELGARYPDDLEPLGAYLARRLPRRVSPPGEVFNYSNFGITLAAHLVEAATDGTFVEFIEKELFQPLGMHADGFAQPLPDVMETRLAHTYRWDGSNHVASQWRDAASQVYPAGAYATTAADMAAFMIAHLQQGRYGDTRILEEDTVHAMHTPQFAAHPALRQQQGLGFHLRKHAGQQLVWHTGRVDMFTAQLVLVPQLDLGLFMVCNADEGDQLRNDVVDILADHLFPDPPPREQPLYISLPEETLAQYTGAYRQVRHVRDSLEKLGFLGHEIYFRPDGRGGLLETRLCNQDAAIRWTPVAGYDTDVFEARDKEEPLRLVFTEDSDGTLRYANMDRMDYTVLKAYERLGPHEYPPLHMALFGICLLLFVSAVLRWTWISVVRRRVPSLPEASFMERAAHHLAGATAATFLFFTGGIISVLVLTDMYLFAFGIPLRMQAVLLLPRFAFVLTLLFTCCLLASFRKMSARHTVRRVYVILLCGAAWVFLWLLQYWRL